MKKLTLYLVSSVLQAPAETEKQKKMVNDYSKLKLYLLMFLKGRINNTYILK